jgi:hypothetical protein
MNKQIQRKIEIKFTSNATEEQVIKIMKIMGDQLSKLEKEENVRIRSSDSSFRNLSK